MRTLFNLALAALLLAALALQAQDKNTVSIRSFAEYGDATAIRDVKPAKNIILMIGDGMGFNSVSAARVAMFGRGAGLAMDRMPYMGQSLVWSLSDDFVTDSGAGATSLASGVKTLNSRIGMDKDARRVRTILSLAKSLGKSTGVLSTCSVTHATPAAFLANVKSRSNEWEIARQISEAPVDVLLGGGRGYFLPGSHKESLRDDDLDLLDRMRKNGMTVVSSVEEFKALDLSKVQKVAGLFDLMHPPKAPERKMSLAEMVEAGLSVLSRNRNGFFLMVEGSQIDWEGHANSLQGNVDETLDFDRAVAAAMEFAAKDGNTLLIVTADHETGGLSINNARERAATVTGGWTTGSHTGNAVPLYAFGPNAAAFAGLHQHHHIPQLAVQAWGVKNFTGFAYDK